MKMTMIVIKMMIAVQMFIIIVTIMTDEYSSNSNENDFVDNQYDGDADKGNTNSN